jgi:hypothetical protein
LKANIKRKEAVTALGYMGCHYVAALVQSRSLVYFDNKFFEALHKEFLKSRTSDKKTLDENKQLHEQINLLQKQNREMQQELFASQNIRRENEDLKLEIEMLESEIQQIVQSKSLPSKTQAQIQEQIFMAQQIADMFNVPKE